MTLILISALAVARLSIMLVYEDGPFNVFYWLRGVGWLSGLLSCTSCVSMWVSLSLVALFVALPDARFVALVMVPAISMAAMIVTSTYKNISRHE